MLGVLLGLYGLLLPTLRRRGVSLPSLRLFHTEEEHEAVDSLIAELERSGFRHTAFESKPLAPRPSSSSPAPASREAPRAASTPPALDDDERDEEVDAPGHRDDVETDDLATSDSEDEVEAPAGDVDAAESTEEGEERSSWDSEDEGLMALFDEASDYYRAPLVIREAIPECTIDELLEEARAVRRLLGGRSGPPR